MKATLTLRQPFIWSKKVGDPGFHCPDKIAVIKTLRMVFGIGLKEAKDLLEDFTDRGNLEVTIEGNDWDTNKIKHTHEYDELTRIFMIKFDVDRDEDEYSELLQAALKKALRLGKRGDSHTLVDLVLDNR